MTESNSDEESILKAEPERLCDFIMSKGLDDEVYLMTIGIDRLLYEILCLPKPNEPTSQTEDHLSRWLLYLGVLIKDAAGSAYCLAFHGFKRHVAILCRQVFECTYKGLYLDKHPEEAVRLSSTIQPRFKKLFERIEASEGKRTFEIIDHYAKLYKDVPDMNRRAGDLNMFEIVKEISPERHEYLYAENYETPSFTLHGAPVGMLDVIRPTSPGKLSWYIDSLFSDINARLSTITWCEGRYCSLLAEFYGLQDHDIMKRYPPLAALYQTVSTRLADQRSALLDSMAPTGCVEEDR